MNIPTDWLYPKSPEGAILAQNQMASRIIKEDAYGTLTWLGGMDVSNFLFDPKKRVFASCVLLDRASLAVVEQASVVETQTFPYIPGLLGFREAPALIHAYNALKQKPDLLMLDGHGISHPRGIGIASHIGLLLDLPSIGVAKSILVGAPVGQLGYKAGSTTPLVYKETVIGMVVRTKNGCNPLYISIGHKISLKSAVEIVLKASKGFRLPEPTRQAHIAANAARRSL